MTRTFFLFFLFAPTLLLPGCKPGGPAAGEACSTSDTTALEAQVMAIHDLAMPRLNEINNITAQLRRIKEATPEDATGKIVLPDGFEPVFDALKMADQGMWDWMKEYNDGKAAAKPENLAAFYQDQLLKVSKVNNDIDKAITDAQTWLKANAPTQ